MEIIESNAALLSNWEVFAHLKQQKEQRMQHDRQKRLSSKMPEKFCTVEFEISQYFNDLSLSNISHITAEQIKSFLAHFRSVPLTKAEKLQIINLQPRSSLELHLIIEECEERFSEEQLNEILMAIPVLFPMQRDINATSNRCNISNDDSFVDNFVPDMEDV